MMIERLRSWLSRDSGPKYELPQPPEPNFWEQEWADSVLEIAEDLEDISERVDDEEDAETLEAASLLLKHEAHQAVPSEAPDYIHDYYDW